MPAPTPEEEIATLHERIEQLQRDLEEARKADPADIAALRAELDTARRELVDLRQVTPPTARRRREGLFEEEIA